MTLNKCLIKFNEIGQCEIDKKKALNYFTDKCFITKWHQEYTLIRVKYKKIIALKIRIKNQDALYLIEMLNLHEYKSDIFNHASTFKF